MLGKMQAMKILLSFYAKDTFFHDKIALFMMLPLAFQVTEL
jgi:hypothetical protein